MNELIIERAKFLIWHFGKDKTVAVKQALKEIGNTKSLSQTYRMFDITENEFIDSLCRMI